MKIAAVLALAVITPLFPVGFATAQEVLTMRSIQEMCGPKWGIRNFIDQTECVMRVLPQSNNPDLVPTDPYIGWYTQMAWKMIDDVRNKRISEDDARDNVQQAYHEVLIRQSQAARDQDDQKAMARKQVRLIQDQERAEAQSRDAAETQAASDAEQDRDREKIRRALSSLSDSLNSIAAAKQQRAESAGRAADEIGGTSSQYEAERAAQRAQQQIADQQARQIAQQPARPVAANVPVRSDPLAPASAPAQTAESRRAAGLPDDPSAAACIQDDDCARALQSKH
ncbi:MAG: hypothetical protein WBE52_00505 [Terriglobales bacterium]|jgi:hypothetical protein